MGHSLEKGQRFARLVIIDPTKKLWEASGLPYARNHGTPEYRAYINMMGRCTNPKKEKYRDYGGRGISVCDKWSGENGFDVFLADVGLRPSNRHSLGRLDNNGNYEPSNVVWQLPIQQVHNRRKFTSLTHFSSEELENEVARRATAISEKWDLRFLDLAKFIASWSHDPSTKVGAVISQGKLIVSTGFNGFPQGMNDSPSLYLDRDEKYSRVIHAEINALLFARRPVINFTLYTWPFPPCDRCCVQLIQAGIKRFVWVPPSEDTLSRWAGSIERTKSYLRQARISFTEIPIKI